VSRPTLAVLGLAALLSAAACRATPTQSLQTASPADRTSQGARAQSSSGQTNADRDHQSSLETAEVEATALRIAAAVAQARSLPLIREVAIRVLDRKQIRAFAKDSLYEHNTPEKLALLGRIESSLGILDADADAEEVILDLLETAVMGIYDPKSKSLLIGSHVGKSMLSMVVGHEIAHGLQDMHFDLAKYQQPLDGQSDAETARTFLIEGDAQASYLAWVSGKGGLASIPDSVLDAQGDQMLALAGVIDNSILARLLQLPYGDGAATVARIARDHGWAAVDALYADLPTTSEQMLHVDKLLSREPAIAIHIDSAELLARLPGYRQVWADELGEATLLAMLADVASVKLARRAAAGWGGDRFVVIERPTDSAVHRLPIAVGMIAWDRSIDADEFETHFRTYLEAKMPGAFVLERRATKFLYATRVVDVATRRRISELGWQTFTVATKGAGAKRRGGVR